MATRTRDRMFAIVGIIIVVVSAAALSVAFIVQQVMTNNSTASNATPADSQIASCSDNGSEKTLTVPEKYTTADPVTDLQTTDITEGTGTPVKSGDCVVAKYYGTLAKDGTLFDENYTKPTGFAFKLGQGQVIKGWDQGVVGMKPGGERRLVIPAALAYGDSSAGSIPAHSDLVFYVTLVRVK